MSGSPKLKVIKPLSYPSEEILELEQVQYFLFSSEAPTIVIVGGQVVRSYEELVRIASQDCYKEYLEVTVLPQLPAGG